MLLHLLQRLQPPRQLPSTMASPSGPRGWPTECSSPRASSSAWWSAGTRRLMAMTTEESSSRSAFEPAWRSCQGAAVTCLLAPRDRKSVSRRSLLRGLSGRQALRPTSACWTSPVALAMQRCLLQRQSGAPATSQPLTSARPCWQRWAAPAALQTSAVVCMAQSCRVAADTQAAGSCVARPPCWGALH